MRFPAGHNGSDHSHRQCPLGADSVIGWPLSATSLCDRCSLLTEPTYRLAPHYCSLDNRESATAVACGYFELGIRKFDIRDPPRPKEIAFLREPPTPLLCTLVRLRSVHALVSAIGR